MESIPTDPGDVTGVVEKVLAKRGLRPPSAYEQAAYDTVLVVRQLAYKYLDIEDLDGEDVEWYLDMMDHLERILHDRKFETIRRYLDLTQDDVMGCGGWPGDD